MAPSKLEQLRTMTTVVADTGDIEAIRRLRPEDATTNPSLLLKASTDPAHAPLLDEATRFARGQAQGDAVDHAMDMLAVIFGREIAAIVPGRVSTEVAASLSFDKDGTIEKARRLIALYKDAGVGRERVLIKIAATYEGIEAARALEQEGINCNLTLLFSFAQAVACAEAGVYLISPFVGRILDWHKAKEGRDFAPHEDPGVLSVTRIYRYYKTFGHETVVMGASFRNAGEIEALAGCDRLTIAPALLDALDEDRGTLTRALSPDDAGSTAIERASFDEPAFRWAMNQDEMATDKLRAGIAGFHADYETLRAAMARRLEAA